MRSNVHHSTAPPPPHTVARLDARKRSEFYSGPHAWWAHDLIFLMFVIFVYAHYSRCARARAERETMFMYGMSFWVLDRSN